MGKEIKDNSIAGMSQKEFIDAINDIEKEYTENDQDSVSYAEYAQALIRGREINKQQKSYYPYIKREA